MPRAALGGNLLHAGLKYVLVAVIHHQGQWANLVSRNVASGANNAWAITSGKLAADAIAAK